MGLAHIISFRPLIGVNFCKRVPTIYWLSIALPVSVPLSGLTSVNDYEYDSYYEGANLVSVPLSGLTSVNPTPSKPL